jgi:sugar/nucleoside kinase (ribokinase family)
VCLVEALPRFADKTAMRDSFELPGGQVATAVLACARLGLRAVYVGSVGHDPAGEAVLEPLRRAGVDISGVKRVPDAPTQIAVILVELASGERTLLWRRDPRLRLCPADLSRDTIESARALHLDAGDPEAAAWAADVARAAGIPVFLDADTPGPGVGELLAKVDFPIVSREFAEGFYETSSVRAALEQIAALGGRLSVVTLGERGALARFGDRVIESPGYRVEARDTTGAGDIFRGALVWAVLRGWGAEAVLRTANAAAAMNCRALGAQGGLPTRAELEAFLEQGRPGPWREIESAAG